MSDNKVKTVLALGYFDSVHLGHRAVISRAKRLAEEVGAKLTVFTFKGNLRALLSGEKETQVYLSNERACVLKDLGVDSIYFAPTSASFLSKGKLAFLRDINKKYNVVGYVCGKDYRFGKLGKGNVLYLKEFAKNKNQTCLVVDDVIDGNQKISTSRIKKLLIGGDISNANKMLGKPFFVTGTVVRDRQVGKEIGFPTINMNIQKDKVHLKEGVYLGHCTVGGKSYRAMINYGSRPTFNLDEKLIEAHLLGFMGELYGKKITLYFNAFIRGVCKFSTKEELIERLIKDKEDILRGVYD